MTTAATDKLSDESQSSAAADLPADGKTVDLSVATATYKLTAIFPQAVGNDLDLIVKYQAADISNATRPTKITLPSSKRWSRSFRNCEMLSPAS